MGYGKYRDGLWEVYRWVTALYGRVTEEYGWDMGNTPTRRNDSPTAWGGYRSVGVVYGVHGRLQVETMGQYCGLQVKAIGKYGGYKLEAT